MKIAVFGSTGGTGLALIGQALQRGHHVTALVRDIQKMPITSPRLEVVQGDVLDPDSARRVVDGADAVISVLGVRLGQEPGTVRSQGTQNIVKALQDADVKRFISVSTIGVGDSLERLSVIARLLLPRIIGHDRLKEAERQEEIIRQSSLQWTILRPPRLVDSPISGHYKIGTDLKTGLGSSIARVDVATALLDQLENIQFIRTTPSVIGR